MSSVAAVPTVNERGEKTVKRVTVARYRKGVAPADEVSSSSSESEDDNSTRKPRISVAHIGKAQGPAGKYGDLSDEIQPEVERLEAIGNQSSSEDEDDDIARRRALIRQRLLAEQDEAVDDSTEAHELEQLPSSSGSGDSAVEESSEEDSDDDIVPSKTLLKPVFVRKEARITLKDAEQRERQLLEEAEKEKAEKEARKLESANLLIEQLKLEAATQRLGISGDMGDDEALEVDDTDDLDPETEYAMWKLRELKRIKRDRLERERIEREQEEIAEIRALPEHERRRRDYERMLATQEQRKNRTQMRYLQKYYHKGAFYQDEDSEVVKREAKDATGEDCVNKMLLPEVMQVKNFGKMGRTKWTHLTKEDTTTFGDDKDARILRNNTRRMGGMKGLDDPRKRRRMD